MTTSHELPSEIFGIPVPSSLDHLARLKVIDNESAHPGLGYTIGYTGHGLELTLYIYTYGVVAEDDGALSPANHDHYLQCVADILRSHASNGERAETLRQQVRGSATTGIEFLSALFVCADHLGPSLSALLITRRAGHFVKLRMTSRLPPIEGVAAIERASDTYSLLLWPHRSETELRSLSTDADG